MRMTNQIMQKNSLYNINQTKILEDKYNTQLTSGSKITRPSDDPVIAIRALRLRSNVSTVSQYYKKNSPDANQWLDVTAQSLNTISGVITSLYKQVETGVNKDYTASDMEVLLTQIEAYTDEMYATGNQDYAGRYIFTGYRTDTALTMDPKHLEDEYTITERIKPSQIDSFSYTDYSVFETTTTSAGALESDITNAKISRIRLSYGELKEAEVDPSQTTFPKTVTYPTVSIMDEAGTDITSTLLSSGIVTYETAEDAYKAMSQNENSASPAPMAVYVESTGEILFDSKTAEKLENTMTDGGSIVTSYQKNKWSEKDLNPQHFFECVDSRGITYNKDGDVDTVISYDVGYNQTIQVNTNATEVFDPAIARDYEDLKKLVSQFSEIEATRMKYQEEMNSYDEDSAEYASAKLRFEAADKAYTYIRDAVSVRFGNQITRYQSYLDATNVAITKNGTRSTRLELIESRLSEQATTFEELQDDNEGIDMTEVAVKLTAAETTYDAALLATSKIMQNSLINYI